MKKNIDNLGRIVIPVEMRKSLNIDLGDAVNITQEENKIIITNPDEIDYKERCERAIEYTKKHSEAAGYLDVREVKGLLEILIGE